MHVDRVLCPVETLGPGRRMAIWTAGCPRRCPGCANPELWEAQPFQSVDAGRFAASVLDVARSQGAHRLTLTGGEPLMHPEELLGFLELVRPAFDDVLVFTGYEADEIEGLFSAEGRARFRKCVDVAVAGPYVQELNDGESALLGSTNQRIVFYDEAMRGEYLPYLEKPRSLQNFMADGRIISVGIHNR